MVSVKISLCTVPLFLSWSGQGDNKRKFGVFTHCTFTQFVNLRSVILDVSLAMWHFMNCVTVRMALTSNYEWTMLPAKIGARAGASILQGSTCLPFCHR